jgi:hypothetical protein
MSPVLIVLTYTSFTFFVRSTQFGFRGMEHQFLVIIYTRLHGITCRRTVIFEVLDNLIVFLSFKENTRILIRLGLLQRTSLLIHFSGSS